MAWTKEQKQAIDSRGGNYLVSAGAGSGKTAVLTERIAQIIAEGETKISEFLVLTFSNKAAHEMKTRIRDKLADNGLTEASEEVERADITTFDAYARRLVVKYHDQVRLKILGEHEIKGINEKFDIIDENYLEIIKREFIETSLPGILAAEPVVKDMFHEYCVKDINSIVNLVLAVQKLADKAPNREELYASLVAKSCADGFIDACLGELYENLNAHLIAASDLTALYPDGNLASFDSEFIDGILNVGSYDEIYNIFAYRKENKLGFKRLSKNFQTDEETKSIRENVKGIYSDMSTMVLAMGNGEKQRERIKSLSPYIGFIVQFSMIVDKTISLFKYDSSCWTFADIFSMACGIVKDDTIRQKLAKQYKYIMVDEYQDTNAMQEEFIQTIASNNVFAVGDIKQSIYRFRNAEPSIFQNKFDKYDQGEGGTLIRLQDNFRSRKEVVDDINLIFGRCMSMQLGGVDYSLGHNFNWGNKDLYASTCSEEHNIEVLKYTDPNKHSSLNQDEREAMVIANDIISKVESGYMVMSKQGMRPCTPSDFAILISRKSRFDIYKRIFAEAKIPLAVSSDSDLSSEDISMTFRSVLTLIYYIDRDDEISKEKIKFAYASIMRSYLVGADDETIYRTIKNGTYLVSDVISSIRFNKPKLMKMSVRDATDELLHIFPFVDNLPKLGNTIANFEKLKSILDVASSLDKIVTNIEDYYSYFYDLERFGLKLKVKESGEAGEGVQLMSIHASKGLEFPVIYCPDLARRVNKDDASGNFLTSDIFGIALPKGKTDEYSPSMLHYLISQQGGAEAQNEFLRLFYVSLTRAKEKIILVTKKDDSIEYKRINSWQVLKLKRENDENGLPKFTTSIRSADSFLQYLAIADIPDMKTKEVNVIKPKELSASSMVEENVPAPTFKSVDIKPIVKERNRASKSTIQPMDEAALAYGTRLHRLLELVDFKTKDTSFIRSGKERNVIDKVLNIADLPDFSDAKVFHEYSFYDKESNIHGSIDLLLVYEDYAYVIDFKAKHIDDPEYGKQLKAYKAYVEKAFKLPCKTALLSILEAAFKVVE
ncbi:MAG: UvrD-helicase domain-containing protein [Bacilli bacterium]|nr:UvrD-helicase domain-containing protein [Bacilli bacterium]